jgi:hypothetical protein
LVTWVVGIAIFALESFPMASSSSSSSSTSVCSSTLLGIEECARLLPKLSRFPAREVVPRPKLASEAADMMQPKCEVPEVLWGDAIDQRSELTRVGRNEVETKQRLTRVPVETLLLGTGCFPVRDLDSCKSRHEISTTFKCQKGALADFITGSGDFLIVGNGDTSHNLLGLTASGNRRFSTVM